MSVLSPLRGNSLGTTGRLQAEQQKQVQDFRYCNVLTRNLACEVAIIGFNIGLCETMRFESMGKFTSLNRNVYTVKGNCFKINVPVISEIVSK